MFSKILPVKLLDPSSGGQQQLSYPRFLLFCLQQVFIENVVPQVQDRAHFLRPRDIALCEESQKNTRAKKDTKGITCIPELDKIFGFAYKVHTDKETL